MDDITVHIIDREDQEHEIQIPLDVQMNMMEVCKASELPVEGTCGGIALCATCHVYILSDNDLPQPSDDEMIMLDQAFLVKKNSRLACQLKVNESLDGLRIALAPNSF